MTSFRHWGTRRCLTRGRSIDVNVKCGDGRCEVTTVEVKAGTWSKYRDVQWIRGEDRVSGREKKWYRIRERERVCVYE